MNNAAYSTILIACIANLFTITIPLIDNGFKIEYFNEKHDTKTSFLIHAIGYFLIYEIFYKLNILALVVYLFDVVHHIIVGIILKCWELIARKRILILLLLIFVCYISSVIYEIVTPKNSYLLAICTAIVAIIFGFLLLIGALSI